MKLYTGTKQVMAEPMNELAAVDKGFACKNEDNHEWREGYHVQYANPDGSTYDPWLPKQVFEQAYRPSETFLDRLKIEHDELNDRLTGLSRFLDKNVEEVAEQVGIAQTTLLYAQRSYMKEYSDILNERIEIIEEQMQKEKDND